MGCGDREPTEITDVSERRVSVPARPVSSAERFGFTRRDPHGQQPTRALDWTLPEGWKEAAPTDMRVANFTLAREPELECYLSVLPGSAGGLAANVNRWRRQMGLAGMAVEAIARLPQKKLLGLDAFYVDLEGTFTGMGGKEPRAGHRMLGLVLEQTGRTIFLKMIGPAAAVEAERSNFIELAASMRVVTGHGDKQAAPEAEDSSGLNWTLPQGWERRGAREMRLVTFSPRGNPDVECYITLLPGLAGGVAANINRWRGQMGQPALTRADLDKLTRVEVLGRESPMVEVTGNLTDMSGNKISNAALLGVVCTLDGQVMFIKMTGPADAVLREKANFVTFCESLSTP